MITITQAIELVLVASVVVGMIGSTVEYVGNAAKMPKLVAFGKKLEAIGQDIPKLLGKRAPDPSVLKAEVASTLPPGDKL